MDTLKMKKEMLNYGFDFEESNDEDKLAKAYKCYCSKKCNDEKYARLKKMFEYCRNDPDFKNYMGADFAKLGESFKEEVRGQVTKIDFHGMNITEVFMQYKLGVKEVCKKGFSVVEDTYVKS